MLKIAVSRQRRGQRNSAQQRNQHAYALDRHRFGSRDYIGALGERRNGGKERVGYVLRVVHVHKAALDLSQRPAVLDPHAQPHLGIKPHERRGENAVSEKRSYLPPDGRVTVAIIAVHRVAVYLAVGGREIVVHLVVVVVYALHFIAS